MKIVIGQKGAHGPIVVDQSWSSVDDETQVALKRGEVIGFGLGADEDPPWYIEVGIDKDTGECYVDASSDSIESTERVWSFTPEEW